MLFQCGRPPKEPRSHPRLHTLSTLSARQKAEAKTAFTLGGTEEHLHQRWEGFPKHCVCTMQMFPLPVCDDGKLRRSFPACGRKERREGRGVQRGGGQFAEMSQNEPRENKFRNDLCLL